MSELANVIKKFKNKKMAVIGDIMLDRFITGNTDRISQEAPVPIVSVENEYSVLGGAGNVSVNVKDLGAKVTLIGIVGNDYAGNKVKRLLLDKKINSFLVSESSRITTEKIRLISSGKQIARIDRERVDQVSKKTLDRILKFIKSNIIKWDGVVISDYAKGLLSRELAEDIIKISEKYKKPIFVDTKPGHFDYFKNVFIIKPNYKEALEFTGLADIDDSAKYISDRLNCNVLITHGEKGMAIMFRGNKSYYSPAKKSEVSDIVGAGDTVIASFALASISGADPENSLKIANHAAGIVVNKFGTSSVTPEELKKSLSNNDKSSK